MIIPHNFSKRCPRCGAVVTAQYFVCPVCGVRLNG